jgi:hypothetical protein
MSHHSVYDLRTGRDRAYWDRDAIQLRRRRRDWLPVLRKAIVGAALGWLFVVATLVGLSS